MNLVPDVKDWPKWWSIRFAALAAAFSAVVVAYATLPPDWLPAIPLWLKTSLAVGALVSSGGAAFARVIDQPSLRSGEQ
jgi:hypothetical protein